ncbi:nucleotide exchange factor GrpE [Thiospirillum jenense]|uniref:Protein GrpE n=1 Tax=Thiospirillum jenense TaxID=1653858 RepID=A0A839HCG0_9GAMM|nr:nucleotide exchange factor GrpE [Thiospirillum jenense]MBB1126351.1 nucleotide exchange factor GrpE [Thiospirillum jenense]
MENKTMQEQVTGADARIEPDAPATPELMTTEQAPPVLPADPAELILLLEDARTRADQTHEQLLYARADIENLKRRHTKELENAHKFALEGFARELLQVRDSLELGHAAALEPDANFDKLREGMELTLKLLSDVMNKFGVVRIDPDGEPFNPEYHQAISMQPRTDVPPGTIVTVIQSGYSLNGRLMRPALVMVAQLSHTN